MAPSSRLAISCLLVVAACHGSPDRPSAGLSDAEVARIHDAVEGNLGRGLATGYSVAVWRDGAVIYAEGFGARNDAGEPVSPATLFQIGSDTKKLTALALLRQVQTGSLDLDQTIGEVLPGLVLASDPAFLDTVSLHDLLSQQTGLFDYTPWTEDPGDDRLDAIARGRFADNEFTRMPAGIAHSYSNPNYSLAGLVTQTIAGRPWPDIVVAEVLVPLGMKHTYPRRDDMLAAETDIASARGTIYPAGHDSFDVFEQPAVDGGWVAPADQLENAFTRPAGLVWSTASDQALLLGFLIDGDETLLSEQLRAAMTSPQVPYYNHTERVAYGYGLFVQDFYLASDGSARAVPYLWHDGSTLTMASASLMLPEQRVAVSVLANGQDEELAQVAQVALEVAAGDRLPAATERPDVLGAPAADQQRYAGSFTDPSLGEVAITWDVDHLAVDIPLLDDLAIRVDPILEPVGLDLFVLTIGGEPIAISFYDGEDGTPHQYGVARELVLTRVDPLTGGCCTP